MESFDWDAFLRDYNAELLASEHVAETIRHGDDELAEAVRTGWLGYPGATEKDLQQAEKRLGTTLPPGYRAFLGASNGWRCPSVTIPRLWSTEEIEWLAITDPDVIEAYADQEPVRDQDYFVYGTEQHSYLFRSEYLAHALRIGEREVAGTALYLLIPDVVTARGEWEAWMLAHWLPGAKRYRSFRELMEDERSSFLQLEAHAARRMRPADPLAQLPSKLSNLIDELSSQARLFRQIERQQAVPGDVAAGATAAGLEEVADRVRQLQQQNLDPEALLLSLRALQQETMQQHLDAGTRRPAALRLTDVLSLRQTAAVMSRAEGYRQAAARIDWFIQDAAGL
jgi:hypothetical protein